MLVLVLVLVLVLLRLLLLVLLPGQVFITIAATIPSSFIVTIYRGHRRQRVRTPVS